MRISNEIRKVFIRLFHSSMNPTDIAKTLDVSIKTVYNWMTVYVDKGEEGFLFIDNSKPRRLSDDELTLIFSDKDNLSRFNYELEELTGLKKSSIHKYRTKLGFKLKKVKTIFKEANPELKKTS